MRFGWFRRLSRWGVSALGAILALWGLGAMWEGWDKIQIERGWSLFIAGSVAVAGGVVTLALGAILSRLDHAIFAREPRSQAAPAVEPEPAKKKDAPESPSIRRPETAFAAALNTTAKEPIEVDHYVSGDTTYVMFSDGSVEVRGSSGAQRFSSLSELKARVGEQI